MKVSIINDNAIQNSSLPSNLELSKIIKRYGNNRNEKDKPSPYYLLHKIINSNNNNNNKTSIINKVLLEQNSCVKEVHNDNNASRTKID